MYKNRILISALFALSVFVSCKDDMGGKVDDEINNTWPVSFPSLEGVSLDTLENIDLNEEFELNLESGGCSVSTLCGIRILEYHEEDGKWNVSESKTPFEFRTMDEQTYPLIKSDKWCEVVQTSDLEYTIKIKPHDKISYLCLIFTGDIAYPENLEFYSGISREDLCELLSQNKLPDIGRTPFPSEW